MNHCRVLTHYPSGHNLSAHDLLLCEKQLATRWGVSLKKIQKARYAGGGVDFIRLGRAIRYRLSDVIAFEEANRHSNTSAGGEP
jgi:hypothetical protein